MTIEDLRGSWPCAWCDATPVTKRGTICTTCQLRADADFRHAHDLAGPQQRLMNMDQPMDLGRSWQTVTPKGEYL